MWSTQQTVLLVFSLTACLLIVSSEDPHALSFLQILATCTGWATGRGEWSQMDLFDGYSVGRSFLRLLWLMKQLWRRHPGKPSHSQFFWSLLLILWFQPSPGLRYGSSVQCFQEHFYWLLGDMSNVTWQHEEVLRRWWNRQDQLEDCFCILADLRCFVRVYSYDPSKPLPFLSSWYVTSTWQAKPLCV